MATSYDCRRVEVDVVTLAAEYPNDNPALHCGVIWVCRTLTGPAEPEFQELIVEELEPLDIAVPEQSGILPIASASTSALPPAPGDAFTVLVCTLVDVAIGANAPNVAAILPRLLHEGRVDAIDERVERTLRASGVWNGSEVSAPFVAVVNAWRAILCGTSEDFDACRGTMLDQWSSELLAPLLGRSASSLRSELRTRGVAAFGLVDAAA